MTDANRVMTMLNESTHQPNSIWHACYDTEEGSFKRLKSRLMMMLVVKVRESGMSQKDMAVKLAITQPRLSNIMNGEMHKVSIDCLVKLLLKLGVSTDVTFQTQAPEVQSNGN